MKYLGRLASLFVLTLALGLFTPQTASATGDWSDLWNWFTNYYQEHHDSKSVPIPGTFLLLGGGLAGLAWWHAKHPRV